METDKNKERPLVDIVSEILDTQDYSEQERIEAVEKTTAMLAEAALIRSLDSSNEETQKAFQALIEKNPTDDQLQEFIQEQLPQFNQMLGEEIKTLSGAVQ
jgi:Na+-transporting NADH:ubiquinone oxidoreductase subunit NqrC